MCCESEVLIRECLNMMRCVFWIQNGVHCVIRTFECSKICETNFAIVDVAHILK